MKVSIAEAENCLDDLASRAAAGEEVILTRNDEAVVRLLPIQIRKKRKISKEFFKALQAEVRAKATPGPSAARS
ncbi:type II toxin-antitoxin system Phd/YefM family antitoxin [Jiella mangrovi]|uniref:Type II toxin-antitoxin system Phd/YefM family antitoxin n=1 Tax=Jiella mangrovi TaxID=2821407 RepID=A0ABS4BHX4_9HYPH|nr:type II toxin-antitoxin system Phd/YefM family antitoxin [Jiella mangrovi]MBP0616291.1 type II toxin-antitoxin system Phd/YefM family antitoxin [Jiella mangrovi]